jgi:hypothetical protein
MPTGSERSGVADVKHAPCQERCSVVTEGPVDGEVFVMDSLGF